MVVVVHLLIQAWKGKNQIINQKIEKINVLEATLEEWRKLTHDYNNELKEEKLRTKAITELYDEKCEQYDELYAHSVANIFKPVEKKFLTLEVSSKALEDEIGKTMNLLGKVINA